MGGQLTISMVSGFPLIDVVLVLRKLLLGVDYIVIEWWVCANV